MNHSEGLQSPKEPHHPNNEVLLLPLLLKPYNEALLLLLLFLNPSPNARKEEEEEVEELGVRKSIYASDCNNTNDNIRSSKRL
jgi:hypothetical protein